MKPMLKKDFVTAINSLLANGFKPTFFTEQNDAIGLITFIDKNGDQQVERVYCQHTPSRDLIARRFTKWFNEIIAAYHAEAAEEMAEGQTVLDRDNLHASDRGRAEAFQLTFRLSDEVTQRRTVEAAHAEALEENDMFDGIIRDGLTPEQRAIQTRREGMDIYGERFKAMLEADHAEALKMDEEITFVREFESLTAEQAIAYAQQWAYSNADAATKQKMFDRDHDEAFRIDAAVANTDVTSPLRIISDYMLRFMSNNKDAKLFEAKERLEKKITLFIADGYDEQRLRGALSDATSSHTREAFLSAIQF